MTLKIEMNCTWKPITDRTSKREMSTHYCVKCGCERWKIPGTYLYSRSGYVKSYSFGCIDWDVENAKTID